MPARTEIRPNGEADPSRVRVGRHFHTRWAFITEGIEVTNYVYEVYERGEFGFAAEHPVYVGVTSKFSSRWSSHLSQSWWIPEARVLCVTLTGYATRTDARKAEAALINEHRPRFNTKPERRYLRLAQASGLPDPAITAELAPTNWRRS